MGMYWKIVARHGGAFIERGGGGTEQDDTGKNAGVDWKVKFWDSVRNRNGREQTGKGKFSFFANLSQREGRFPLLRAMK